MKTKLIAAALLGCTLFGAQMTATGKNDKGQGPKSKSLEQGAAFSAKFMLKPTPDAPPGAKGMARLVSGDGPAAIDVHVQGLAAGTYPVVGVRASDGSSVALGDISVGQAGNSAKGKSKKKFKNATELPPDVDPADIRQVMVADGGGTALLVGDLSDATGKSKAMLRATVPLTAGPAAPDATGFARLKSKVHKGVRKDHFTMIAFGVPADATFTVQVNGVASDTVNSNGEGKVLVKELPEGLSTITSVVLADAAAVEVVRADF